MDCVAVDSEVVVVVVVVVVTASSTLEVYSLLVWQSVEEGVLGTSIVALTYKLISLTTVSHSSNVSNFKNRHSVGFVSLPWAPPTNRARDYLSSVWTSKGFHLRSHNSSLMVGR